MKRPSASIVITSCSAAILVAVVARFLGSSRGRAPAAGWATPAAQIKSNATGTPLAPSGLGLARPAPDALTLFRPVSFYGQVLDFSNAPVAQAEIDYQWSTEGGVFCATNHTDAKGRFIIRKNRALSLFVTPKKEGYQTIFTNDLMYRAGESAFPITKPAQPYVFRLRKRAGEHLIPISRNFIFKANNGFSSEPVEITPAPRFPTEFEIAGFAEPHERGEKFDWSFSFRLRDGAVLRTDEPFPVEAPTTNRFESEFSFSMPKSARAWTNDFNGTLYFYVGTNRPVFGRINITIIGGAGGFMSGVYNPTGSRVLD